jgi:hypothetical protein
MKLSMESPNDHFDDPEDLIAYEGPLLQEFIHEDYGSLPISPIKSTT